MVDPNARLRELINAWCQRRELRPLARLLPAYVGNNGLTDGYGDLRNAVRDTYALCRDQLPSIELESLRDVERELDSMLSQRA